MSEITPISEAAHSIQEILNQIETQNDGLVIIDGLELLLKLIWNIVNQPNEPKFRTINSSKQKIQTTIFCLKGGIENLLLTLRFTKTDEVKYQFEKEEVNLLRKGIELIERLISNVKARFYKSADRVEVQGVPWSYYKWEALEESFSVNDPDVS